MAESGLIPDEAIRRGTGLLNRKRLRLEEAGSAETRQKKKNDFIEGLKRSPIVLQPEKPREQHYKLPPAFFQRVMGNRMKYSCGLWTDSIQTLDFCFFYVFYPVHPVYLCEYFFRKHFLYLGQKIRLACPSM